MVFKKKKKIEWATIKRPYTNKLNIYIIICNIITFNIKFVIFQGILKQIFIIINSVNILLFFKVIRQFSRIFYGTLTELKKRKIFLSIRRICLHVLSL